MGDDDRGALPTAQHVFQPGDAIEVEMVGGLVQQQQIRFVDQGTGQRDAFARSSGQAGDLHVGRQAELFEHGAHARRALPVFVVAFRIADYVEDRGVLVEFGFLLDGGYAQAGTAGDVAVVGLGPAVQQPQQGGLAGAVAADEADALASLDGEIGVIQQRVVAIGQLDVGKRDEGSEGHVIGSVCVYANQGVLSQERAEPFGEAGRFGDGAATCTRIRTARRVGRSRWMRIHRGRSGLHRAG
ncbi:hypothetical protein D9M68_570540 [compost metagenome]